MSLDESFLEKLRGLPPEGQREVIDFVEFLHKKSSPQTPKRSLAGLWADLNLNISEDNIKEARTEMWGKSPREDY